MESEEIGDLEKEVARFENMGFRFLQAWTMDPPISPDRILLPSGTIYDIGELDKMVEKITKIPEGGIDLEVYRASQFYSALRELPASKRDGHDSFIDDEDMAACLEKYPQP